MNQYTTAYASEQLIWSIIDRENIVNYDNKDRCWTEPAKGATGEHAHLIQELLQGFRINVGRKEFWHPHPENSWLTQGMDAARIAYGYKMIEGMSSGSGAGRLHLNNPIKTTDHEINMHEAFKASCDEHLVNHFVIDSLKFAIKMLAPLTPIGANPGGTYTTVAIAIDKDRKRLEQQIRTYIL